MPGVTLAQARDSIWNSIENNAGTSALFKRKLKINGEQNQFPIRSLEPSMGDMPAIMVLFRSMTPQFWTGQTEKQPLVFNLTIWTPHWNQDAALDAIQKTYDAIYTTPHPSSSSFTYIEAPISADPPGTCFHPLSFRVYACDLANVGGGSTPEGTTPGTRCFLTQIELVLRRTETPFVAS